VLAVDEKKIRDEVFSRVHDVSMRVEWFTPSGRRRSVPSYEATIGNVHLRVTKTLKAPSEAGLRGKIQAQMNRWCEQEVRSRIGAAAEDADEDAAGMTEQAKAKLDAILNILRATLEVDDRIKWEELNDRSEFPPFQLPHARPEEPKPLEAPPPPRKPFFSWLFKSVKQKWLDECSQQSRAFAETEERRRTGWQNSALEWDALVARAQENYNRQREAFYVRRQEDNDRVSTFRAQFEAGSPEAIEEYLRAVFERSAYPEGFFVEHRVAFDAASKTVVVDLSLPEQSSLPSVVECRFVKRTKEITSISMKKKEHDELYDSAIKQAVLRTIHEVFESVYTEHVVGVVINGWVTALNASTGNDETQCVISVGAERAPFLAFNLARIDPSECIRRLKGFVAGPLAALSPVRPIMQFDRRDSRFIEAKDVLGGISTAMNLAEMPWNDFEHLVRQLFDKLFQTEGAEVRVTQASHDLGVDAVVFDPDPIRGGKFVIQAKRYTKVVPSSAVRELYGTMLNEGAAKGILVTTAHFGREAREFAKDKPITLIDGSNLVYLLGQQGHEVRVDVVAARGTK